MQVCVPTKLADNFTLCDGSRDTDAAINECGVCYGGLTNLTAEAGRGECGECEVEGGRPRDCKDCLHRLDDCGQCGLPDGPDWNGKGKGCGLWLHFDKI